MTHRLAPQAEAELDDIWYYIAKESHSLEIADRAVDSITDRFYLLATFPHVAPRLLPTSARRATLLAGTRPVHDRL